MNPMRPYSPDMPVGEFFVEVFKALADQDADTVTLAIPVSLDGEDRRVAVDVTVLGLMKRDAIPETPTEIH
jgi:hypothetical protein